MLEDRLGTTPTTEEVSDAVKARFDSGDVGGSRLLFRYLPPLFLGMNASADTFGLGNGLMIVFILTLLFAGISSLIALSEVFIEGVRNTLGIRNTGSLLIWAILGFVLVGFYSTSFGGKLVDLQDGIVMTFILLIGIIQISLFVFSSNYSKVVGGNDEHTFLKLSPLHWFKILVVLVPLPILVIFGVFGAMNFFGVNYLIANASFFEKFKDKNDFFATFYKKSIGTEFILDKEQIISLSFFAFSTFVAGSFALISSKRFNRLKYSSVSS